MNPDKTAKDIVWKIHQAYPPHSVLSRSNNQRPEACRAGVQTNSRSPTRVGSHQSSPVMRLRGTPPGFKVGADAKRYDELGVPVPHPADRGAIQMIVVVMGNDDRLGHRQILQGDQGSIEALRAHPGEGRGAIAPYRVREDPDAVHFQVDRGMAQPGGAKPFPGG